MIMRICKFPMPSCTVICIYV